MRNLLMLCVVSLSTGCALYPLAQDVTPGELIEKGKTSPLIAPDVTETRYMVAGLKALLAEDVEKRQTTEIVVSEIGYYGAMLSVAGSLKNSIAARKFGGGLAALASAFTGRYKTSEQKLAFGKALKRVDCIGRALGPVNPAVRELFDANAENDDLLVRYSNIPQQTTVALDTIRLQLEIELAGISLGTQTQEQMAAAFTQWLDAKKKSEDAEQKDAAADAQSKIAAVSGSNPAAFFQAPDGSSGTICSRDSAAAVLACDISDFKNRSPAQQYDEIRQFQAAVLTYEATLATCIAEPK